MSNQLVRRFVIGILGVALLTSLWVTFRRWHFESHHRAVEMVVSLTDMTRMSRLAGVPLENVMSDLQSIGLVSSIAVEESSIEELVAEGKATVLDGSEIARQFRLGLISGSPLLNQLIRDTSIRYDRLYILFDDPSDFNRVYAILSAEMGARVETISSIQAISIIGDREDILELGVGIAPDKISLVRTYGFSVIPRFRNSVRVNSELIKLKFSQLSSADLVDTIIFDGSSVLGFPKHLGDLKEQMGRFGYNFGVIEFADQDGIGSLAHKYPESVLRVHSFSESEIENLSTDIVVNRYVRAVNERNTKIVFLKPYFTLTEDSLGKDLLSANYAYFAKVAARIEADGHVIKPIKRMVSEDYAPVRTFERVLIGLGVGVLVWILAGFFGFSSTVVLGVVLVAVIASAGGLIVVGAARFWGQLVALCASIVTPSIAIIYFFRHPLDAGFAVSRFWAASRRLIAGFVVTILGALMTIALLSEYGFVVGSWQFLGVKFAFLLPLVIVFLYFFIRPNRLKDIGYLVRRLLGTPVQYAALLFGVIAVVFMAVYIIRSGNYMTMDGESSERVFRESLESVFKVRPRTKEILVGYPLLLAALMLNSNYWLYRWRWAMICLGGVGFISVFNSFCHIHTPLELTVHRSLLGIVGGIVVFGLGLGLWDISKRILSKWGR